MTLTFRPIKLECVVVMRGDKVVGTIRRYRNWKACIVSVPGLLTPGMAIGQGKASFRTIPEAKKALRALDLATSSTQAIPPAAIPTARSATRRTQA